MTLILGVKLIAQIISTSSSLTHEESYSYDMDDVLGVHVIDR